ncbi:hypothetical protein [Campylobacter iguaniorum]|uniref:hypothetical protein n=1 Tax=Campylobacter iguaniorum TaxID=1244531 RepID=UPI00130DBB52|nr:hypothetical protein [Campylobacter iguaniorum]
MLSKFELCFWLCLFAKFARVSLVLCYDLLQIYTDKRSFTAFAFSINFLTRTALTTCKFHQKYFSYVTIN